MLLLEWYEILLWKKDGKYYVSESDCKKVHEITKKGYSLIGNMTDCEQEIQNVRCQLELKNVTTLEISRLLDEQLIEPINKLLEEKHERN